MKPYELDRFLRDEGFTFLRFGSKHKIYAYQGARLIVPQGKSVRPSTMNIIRKTIKNIQAQALSQGKAPDEDFPIPEEACDPIIVKGENTTELSEEKFHLYSDIIEFCQARMSYEPEQYTLTEVLRFLDKQLYHFNNLVEEAVAKHDLNVLFDLKEALAIVQVSSHQISDAIDDFETLTAPTPVGYTIPPKGTETQTRTEFSSHPKPASFVTDRKRAPMPAPIAPVSAFVPAEVVSISAPPAVETKPAPATVSVPAPQSTAPRGLSVRQVAVAEIMAIFGRLGPEDTGPVLKQVTGFVEMG